MLKYELCGPSMLRLWGGRGQARKGNCEGAAGIMVSSVLEAQ